VEERKEREERRCRMAEHIHIRSVGHRRCLGWEREHDREQLGTWRGDLGI